MTDKRMAHQHHATFESIRRFDKAGSEFWSARDSAPLLEYQDWRNFMQFMDKARVACVQSGHDPEDHFGDVTNMVSIGSAPNGRWRIGCRAVAVCLLPAIKGQHELVFHGR